MACKNIYPCSSRTGSLIVGITDLMTGSAALSAICFILYIISTEMAGAQDNTERLHILSGLYWSILLAYGFPSLVALTTGIFVLLTVTHRIDCCAIISILLTLVLVFACAGTSLILYLIGIERVYLIPLILTTAVQMYFTFVLLAFRAKNMRSIEIA